MTFILIDDERTCNHCVYWTGMRKKDDEFVYADIDAAEWGICLHPNSVRNSKPTASCEGCSRCCTSASLI